MQKLYQLLIQTIRRINFETGEQPDMEQGCKPDVPAVKEQGLSTCKSYGSQLTTSCVIGQVPRLRKDPSHVALHQMV